MMRTITIQVVGSARKLDAFVSDLENNIPDGVKLIGFDELDNDDE